MSRAALWDEVWAEYDARQARAPAPAPRPAGRPVARAAARRRPWWLLGLGAAAAVVAYAASPLAAALHLASAVQRADVTALSAQADWERLRPGIEARLEAMATQRLEGPAPGFVRQMQGELAARLASPQGVGALVGGPSGRGAAPAREWLQGARLVEPGRWNVTLARPEMPERAATLTLELQDPLRLRWQVVQVAW